MASNQPCVLCMTPGTMATLTTKPLFISSIHEEATQTRAASILFQHPRRTSVNGGKPCAARLASLLARSLALILACGERGKRRRERQNEQAIPPSPPAQVCVLRLPLARDRCSTADMHAPTSTSSPLQAAPRGAMNPTNDPPCCCGGYAALTHPRLLAVHLVPVLYPCLHPVCHFRTGHGLRRTRPDFIYRLCVDSSEQQGVKVHGNSGVGLGFRMAGWAHVTGEEPSMSCNLWGMGDACGVRRAEGLP